MVNTKNFNAIVYTGNKEIGMNGFVTYRKQTNLERFKAFLDTKYPKWSFATLYDRKTNEKSQIKP